ncbi:hypothetical protein OOT09_34785, partial [Streptomyces sp. NBC_00199]|nr:hypothetical protein [Streptomyces sp. NBC_00199]
KVRAETRPWTMAAWQSHVGWNRRKCYSNYIADVKHKSTVRVINIDHSSGWVAKGATSYAHHTQGAAYTCYAYYDNA